MVRPYFLDRPSSILCVERVGLETVDRHEIDQIDLLSLHVEGFEQQVLQGLDLNRHQPRFMLIEARFRDEIDEYLVPLYEFLAELSHHDVVYMNSTESSLIPY